MLANPMLSEARSIQINRTHGGHLLVLPPPKVGLIAEEVLRDSDFAHRRGYYITLRGLNAWATYRLETCERRVWIARLVEWSTI